jgi:hypothetical protein
MTQSRRCWAEPARYADGYGDRQTLLPPPPDVALPDPRAPLDCFSWIPDISFDEVDEDATPTVEMSSPTDVDGTPWWDGDEEDAVLTERPLRLH